MKKKRPVVITGAVIGTKYPVNLKDWLEEDLEKLSPDVRDEAIKKLDKLQENPRAMSLDAKGKLNGCYSIHFNNNRHRIVLDPVLGLKGELKSITILAIGKRDKNYVYSIAEERKNKLVT